ncbi:MAG: ABC transporter permease [Verrucomicrobia bacterium]|nr:ABC transporter permease [Verrucomicrobiota bacterium]
MRRILAIANIAIHSAVRSRMVVCLIALLAIAVIGLPLTIKGDGTAEGQLRVTITYSLGAAFALLALASLWAGALSIAREIEDKQIQLLATKPVRRAEIWIGKWLGLMTVNSALLLAAAAATGLLLPREKLNAQTDDNAPAWTAVHRSISPQHEDRSEEARAQLAQRKAAGAIPEGVDDATALRAIQQELLVRAATVAPAQQRTWHIQLPRALRADEQIRLRFRYSASSMGLDTVRGRWIIGTPAQPAIWQTDSANTPEIYQSLAVPANAFANERELTVTYVNQDPSDTTLVFNPQDGLRVLVPAGTFLANYARAIVLLLLRLGFLTALGVTAGAIFSSPVALFVALALMAMSQMASFTTSDALLAPSGLSTLLAAPSRALQAALAPLGAPPALDAVASGLLVETRWLLRVAFIQLALYGGALAALGTRLLNRRELALPAI